MNKLIGGLLFLSELILWIGAGRLAALLVPFGSPWDAIFGLAVTVLFVTLWAMFFAPRSEHRLDKLPRVLIVVAVSILIGYLLIQKHDNFLGYVVMIFSSLGQVLGQYVFTDYIYPDKLV